MLKLDHLTYSYGKGQAGIFDIDLEIGKEHIYAILGRSGAGKTTLLRCLGRFLKPQKGRILLDGEDIQPIPEQSFRTRLGIVFQNLNLFPHMTVLENVTLAPRKVLKQDSSHAEKDARQMLDQFGIAELAEKYPSEISGGQAQRAAICRAMILKPEYLLLDEPTAALDAETTREFGDFLISLTSDTSFIVVTHDVAFVESTATRGALIHEGHLAAEGEISTLSEKIPELSAYG